MLTGLDSNILLRLVNRADPLHADIRAAVRTLRGRGAAFCFFPQNAGEFWNVCTRPATARGGYGLTVAETGRRLDLLERVFTVLADTPAIYPAWRQLVAAHGVVGVQAHDARLAAAMQVHGVTRFLTLNDQDFRRYSWLTVLTPAAVLAPPPAPPAVPPPPTS